MTLDEMTKEIASQIHRGTPDAIRAGKRLVEMGVALILITPLPLRLSAGGGA